MKYINTITFFETLSVAKCCNTLVLSSVASICWDHDSAMASSLDEVVAESIAHALHWNLHFRRFSNTCLERQIFASSRLGTDECGRPFASISKKKKFVIIQYEFTAIGFDVIFLQFL